MQLTDRKAESIAHRFGSILLLFVVAGLSACAQQERRVVQDSPSPLPMDIYQQAAEDGHAVYRIDSAQSTVRIRVGRAGAMKNLGHDHMIVSEDVQGFVVWNGDPDSARADLAIPLGKLVVDNPDYRRAAGMEPDVEESAIVGTYNNMQKALETDAFPWTTITIRIASGSELTYELSASVDLHGTTHEMLIPATLEIDEQRISVNGETVLAHRDFGLTPFAAAGGLLRVADEMQITFSITAIVSSSTID